MTVMKNKVAAGIYSRGPLKRDTDLLVSALVDSEDLTPIIKAVYRL